MDNLIFVIYKTDKWIVESTNGSNIEKKEHSSRIQGIRALFQRHPRTPMFHLTIPATDTTETQDFLFCKSFFPKKWRFNGREYDSRIKAVNGFLHSHPKLSMFYISIPIDKVR